MLVPVRWAVAGAMLLLANGPAAAKTPGTTYCYLDVCHRVLTLAETAVRVGVAVELIASYYDAPWRDPMNPSMITSSGELFRPEADDSAASPIYPDGTRLLVREPIGGVALVIRINNAGPYFSDRLLDLSRGAAERLGLLSRGVGRVETMVVSVPDAHETRYAHLRSYAPVPGYIGRFGGISEAHAAWRGIDAGAPQPPVRIAALAGPVEHRVVIVPRRGGGGLRRGRGRITLLPVAKRRPLMMRALAVRQRGTSRQALGR